MRLFKVTLRNNRTGYDAFYVIAEDSDKAYRKVRTYLDEKDLCFRSEREIQSIELIADSSEHPECKKMLFL